MERTRDFYRSMRIVGAENIEFFEVDVLSHHYLSYVYNQDILEWMFSQTRDLSATQQEPPENPQIHGMLTRIEYGNNVAYIIGSMHAGRPYWFPLADIVEDAMARADVFAFEVDLAEWNNASDELLEHFNNLQHLPDGTTMADVLPEDILANFQHYLPSFGVAFENVEMLTPAAYARILTNGLLPLTWALELEYSVDFYVLNFALENNKPTFGLEDNFESISRMLDIPMEIQAYALYGFTHMATALDEAVYSSMGMIEAYKNQDRDALLAILDIEHDGYDNPFTRHNNHINFHVRCHIYADGIAALLQETQEPTTFFVTIGLAHIIGGDFGKVLYLLEDKGFEVEALWQ